jgi:hypothetical protein
LLRLCCTRSDQSWQLELALSDGKTADNPVAGVVLDPILKVHRATDSYVTFHKIRDGVMVNDCSLKVEALANYFPEFRDELDRDGYYSLNAFYKPGSGTGMAGLPRAFRRASAARYLNCNFVDIDCHDGPFRFWDVVGRASLAFGDEIPSPSIFVNSGRGVWLLWLLIDEPGSNLPPSAHVPRQLLWGAIQQELGRRLAHIGADPGARDVARISRVPGSLNSHVEQRVKYLFSASVDGRGLSYTMETLAERLKIDLPRMRACNTRPSLPSPWAISGYRALAQHRFDAFRQLRDLRGGFRKGVRNQAAFIFANILRASQIEPSTIEKEVRKLAAECRPPLSSEEVAAILKQKRVWKWRDHTIAERLKVTEEEAALIPRWGRSNLSLPCAAPVDMSPAERRDLISKLVADARGSWPACREMAARLRSLGIQVGHATVNRDYQVLRPSKSFPLLKE